MPVNKQKVKSEKHPLPTWAMYASIALLIVIALTVYFIDRSSGKDETQSTSSTPVTSPLSSPTPGLPASIGVNQAYGLYNLKSVHFVDVRSATDFDAYHLAGSVSIPLDELPSMIPDIPKGETVIIIDQYGTEDVAGKARSTLLDAGFTSVTYLDGGIYAWVQAGYPFIGVAPY